MTLSLHPFNWLAHRIKTVGFSSMMLIGLSVGAIGSAAPVVAAEKLVFTFGILGDSVTVKELEVFAETGKVPTMLRPYLKLTKTNPEVVRNFLTQEATISYRTLDKTLNTLPGEFLLFQVGKIIHTPERVANIQALRSALVMSALKDNKVSLLKFLQQYPLQEVTVDGVALLRAARKVGPYIKKAELIKDRLDGWIAIAKDFLDDLVCDCEPKKPSD